MTTSSVSLSVTQTLSKQVFSMPRLEDLETHLFRVTCFRSSELLEEDLIKGLCYLFKTQ